MNDEEKILKLLKEKKGLITKENLNELNINSIALTRLVKKRQIARIKKGLYVIPNSFADEYYSLTYNTNNAVFSYLTALYFHDLCERVPLEYDITVLRNYGGVLQKEKNVKLHYVDDKIFNLGRITIKSPQGHLIECYDIERCLCDLIKNKEKIYFEYVKYAFVEYYRNQKHDPFKLYEYAKKLGIEMKVHAFMEALL